MSKIKVIDKVISEIEGESIDTIHIIEGIELSERYFDLDVPFDVTDDKIYYLVYGIYNTGDSFHSDTGEIEFVDLYENEDDAYDCQKVLEAHYKVYIDNNKIEFCDLTRSNGIKYRFHAPWIGYFEELCYLQIDMVMLETHKED